MKYQDVLQIIKDFESSKLTSLELEIDDVKVKMTKNCYDVESKNEPVHIQASVPSPSSFKSEAEDGYLVKSPLVGTFYASASPEASAFIHVGDIVKKGDTLCIIEAMKIMNEITAPITGKILSVNAKSGDAIGFNQVLVTIKDAK